MIVENLERIDRMQFYLNVINATGGFDDESTINELFTAKLLAEVGVGPIVTPVDCPPLDPKRKLIVTELIKGEVIYCPSEAESTRICKLIHEAGITWIDGRTYIEFPYYSTGICYNLPFNAYGDVSWFLATGNTIYNSKRF